ncbi:MAG TPA: PKD domain-containing protein [Bacteroidia bacterium]|jgi:gliding motility-associated-like protein|nr:PKD domain-containing protein [Bacteroidia bacterium]
MKVGLNKKNNLIAFPVTGLFVLLFIFSFTTHQTAKAQPCINAFPHVEDFEAGPVWTSNMFYAANDWAWGTPAHAVISTAGSGTKSWCLGGLTGAFYQFNEQSWVQSPCYDFTTLQYPHIWLKVFWESEWKYDGTKLQSSIDNGATWQTIGAFGDANDCNTINWYNTNSTSSYSSGTITGGGAKPIWFPATDPTAKHAWAGNTHPVDVADDPTHIGVTCYSGHGSTKWLTAQHCLTGLAGKPSVIFRITFSCGYACNGYDGFAFDSVAIGNGIINTTTITPTCGGGNTINFNSGAKACPTTTWAWNFGDAASGASNTSAAENPSHIFSGPGTYTVGVVASGGACNPPGTATTVVHVLGASITSFTNATCSVLGSATALATGGTTPTYSWSNGNSGVTATGLSANTYTVFVTDPAACPTQTTVTITQPTPIVVTLSSTPASCSSNNGSATATSVTGGTGAGTYTYSWAPSGGTGTTAPNLATGFYTLTVTDANSCTGTQTVQVANSSGPVVTVSSTSVTCNGGTNGVGTTTVTGGATPITYSWSPIGGTGPTASNLPKGTYTIVVTDASPCSVTNVITIAEPPAITTVTSNTAATCGGHNGMASVVVSGGVSPYTYTWSPTGGNTANATGLGQGTYTINGTDANACTYSTSVTVSQQSAVVVTVTSTPASCGNNNGTATASATGGFPAQTGYVYNWTTVTSTVSIASTATASNLAPGIYAVSVADSLGCATTKTVTVDNFPSPVLSIASTDISCNGLSDGSATVSINAGTGTGPFTYTWSTAGGIDSIIGGLSQGTYTVNVTDVATCTASISITINQPPPLTVTATGAPATCGNPNGSTSCTAGGGTPGYTYTWTPTGGNNTTTTNLPGNIIYTVTVKDNHSCLQTATYSVAGTPALSLSVPTTTNVTCNGGSDGAISVTHGGGTGVISYTWIPSGGTDSTASNLTASVGGTTYTVLAIDAVGCPASATATITEPPPVIVTTTGQTICNGQTAIATATASGGNGGAYTFPPPTTYTWVATSPNNATLSVSPPPGSIVYTVAAQDVKGCPSLTVTVTVTVRNPLEITVTKDTTVCPGKIVGLTTIIETGGLGAGNYTVTWLPSGFVGNPLIDTTTTPNTTTTYTAILSDGCTVATDSAIVSVSTYDVPKITYTATPIAGCAPLTSSFSPPVGNGIAVNSWSWDFGDGTSGSATNNTTHTYYTPGIYQPILHGMYVNANGTQCPDSSGFVDNITVYSQPHADFTASTFETDVYDNTINFTNLSTGVITSNSWEFLGQNYGTGTQNASYTFYPEGTYSVTLVVINIQGCIDSITKEIIIKPIFTFYAPNCVTPNGDGKNEHFLPEGTGWDDSRYNLWIFDRWGVMFHHTTNPYQGWDGTKNNNAVQEDTYVWKVDIYDVFGKPHQYKGIVSVVR